MKNKTMTTIVLGIFLLSFASAMFAGECEQLDLSGLENLDDVVYSVIGNSSDLDGLRISLNETYVNICPAINYKPDNFTLIFWDNSTKEVIKEVVINHRGRTRYVYENITEYVEVEKIVYINETIDWIPKMNDSIDEWAEWEIKEEIGFFEKIWNWIKGLFANQEKKE